jgi:type IV secretion system protein VirB5
MRKLGAIAVLCAVVGAGPAAQAQGIPVFDAQSIAQAIQQLQQMQQQFSQLQQTHQSFNKLTNIGDIASILNNPAVRRALPGDFSAAQSALMGQGANADQYKNADGVYSPANSAYQASVERSRSRAAGQTSVGGQMYDAAAKRIDGLEQLRKKIGEVESPAEKADLQARLQVEIAAANTDVLRMSALAMVVRADERQEEMRRAGEFEKEIEAQSKPHH